MEKKMKIWILNWPNYDHLPGMVHWLVRTQDVFKMCMMFSSMIIAILLMG